MPVPSAISELSQTPGANYPAGSESPNTADNYFRAHAAFIAQLRDGTTHYLTSVGGTNTITATASGISALATGQVFRFPPAATNTGAVTLNINSLGAKSIVKTGNSPLAAGDLFISGGAQVVYDGTRFQLLSAPRPAFKHIAGLVPSTAGSSTTMTISAGEAVDSTGVINMQLSAAMSKTTAAWSAGTGNGGLDTGTIANSTAYYFYLITGATSGLVDVVFSTSSSAPTLPGAYSFYRLIGYGLTNGSAQWGSFTAVEAPGGGLDWVWAAPTLDLNTTTLTTSRVLTTLTVPAVSGVTADLRMTLANAGASSVVVQCPDETDAAPSGTASPGADISVNATTTTGFTTVRTNSSGQVASRATAASTTLRLFTKRFVWSRR